MPAYIPPPSQNRVQIDLDQGLFGPHIWIGGGIEGGALKFHNSWRSGHDGASPLGSCFRPEQDS